MYTHVLTFSNGSYIKFDDTLEHLVLDESKTWVQFTDYITGAEYQFRPIEVISISTREKKTNRSRGYDRNYNDRKPGYGNRYFNK